MAASSSTYAFRCAPSIDEYESAAASGSTRHDTPATIATIRRMTFSLFHALPQLAQEIQDDVNLRGGLLVGNQRHHQQPPAVRRDAELVLVVRAVEQNARLARVQFRRRLERHRLHPVVGPAIEDLAAGRRPLRRDP